MADWVNWVAAAAATASAMAAAGSWWAAMQSSAEAKVARKQMSMDRLVSAANVWVFERNRLRRLSREVSEAVENPLGWLDGTDPGWARVSIDIRDAETYADTAYEEVMKVFALSFDQMVKLSLQELDRSRSVISRVSEKVKFDQELLAQQVAETRQPPALRGNRKPHVGRPNV